MQTKSKIKLIKESNEIRENFKNQLSDLIEKYIVKDSIFYLSNNYTINEAITGYFSINGEFDSLQEAFNDLAKMSDEINLLQSIRIINNEKFQTGVLAEKIEDTNSEKVIDIYTGKNVR